MSEETWQSNSAGPSRWGLERDRYVVLLHLYTIRDTEAAQLASAERVLSNLGVEASRAEDLIGPLIRGNFIRQSSPGDPLVLASAGIEYIEREPRRRSVRLEP